MGKTIVWVQGGVYALDAGLELTQQDSGSAKAPIEYRAAAGEVVRLLGGRRLSGFRVVTDAALLARLAPEARGQVVHVGLRANGISDFGEMVSRGFARPTVPAHLELFFNDQPMTVAQWPKPGQFLKITGFTTPAKDEWGTKLGDLKGGLKYDGDRPLHWAPSDDIWVHGYWSYDWANSYEHVRRLDANERVVETQPPYGHYNFRPGQRFYFLNVLEELDQPGEYYVDRGTGMLYFWPPSPIEQGEAIASVVREPVIRLTDVSYVTLRGLTVECGRGQGIEVIGGSHDLIAGCTVRNLGNWAIRVKGGTDHTVAGCDAYNTGDGAIHVEGGDRKTLAPAGHAVVNNHLHHFGRWSRSYQAGVLAAGVGHRVANNLIHDAPHNGILYWGNDITLEYNEIHRVCLESGDVGAIYTGRDYTFRGNVIRYNYIHHLGGVGMGSSAIYMDDCVSGHVIYGNIVVGGDGIWLGGGRDFIIENNIFVDCAAALAFDARGTDANPVWRNMVNNTMRKRVEDMNYLRPPYITRYPELASLEKHYAGTAGVPPENNRLERNICAGPRWLRFAMGGKADLLVQKDNVVDQDPLFVNRAAGDYRLRADSPALRMGFRPIPVERIGLVADENRIKKPAETRDPRTE